MDSDRVRHSLKADWKLARVGKMYFIFALVCFSAPLSAFGQFFINTYIGVALGTDGNIHAYGTTDASGMFEHSASSTIFLTSAAGRKANGWAGVDTGGYVTANASLPWLDNDIGDYFVETNGNSSCSATGWFASSYSSAIAGIAIHAFTYQLQYILSNGNGHYARCNNPTGICPVIDASPSEFQQSLPTYAIFTFVTVTLFGDTSCFKTSRVRADSCVADPGP